jgi:hypothetical protein
MRQPGPSGSATAWLYRIAHDVCLTKQRNAYRRRLVEAPSDFELIEELVPAHEAESDELFGLAGALRVLPEQQRRTLLLREWQGLSCREIADEMRLSQAAVETLLFRARRSLADALTAEPPATGETPPAAALNRSAVASLVAPGAHARVDAHARDHEEDEGVDPGDPDDEEPPEVDDEQRHGAVEDPLLARLPQPDLAPAEVAPEEVRHQRDCEEEAEAQENARRRERRLEVQHDDEQRDRRDDQHAADEGRDLHAVM